MDQKGKGKESNTSNFFFFGTQVILVTNRRSLHFLAVDPRHMIDYKILDLRLTVRIMFPHARVLHPLALVT